MKPIVFDKELTTENITIFMEEIYASIHEQTLIYFSGKGINITGEKMLVNFLNTISKINPQTELIAFDKLFDSAFSIFFKCNLNKKILKTTIGRIKLPQDIVALKEKRKENRFIYNIAKKDNEDFIKWLSPLYFNKTEGRKIRTGKQVMLDNGRLQDILMNYKNFLIEPI